VSAGKRKTGKRRQGNQALRRALTEAARAAARTKKPQQTYLRHQYRRLVVRLGTQKAAVAVGHSILRIAYHLLTHETTYHEQVLVELEERRRAQLQQRALAQLTALGYDVTLTPKEPAA
jgi:transposase